MMMLNSRVAIANVIGSSLATAGARQRVWSKVVDKLEQFYLRVIAHLDPRPAPFRKFTITHIILDNLKTLVVGGWGLGVGG